MLLTGTPFLFIIMLCTQFNSLSRVCSPNIPQLEHTSRGGNPKAQVTVLPNLNYACFLQRECSNLLCNNLVVIRKIKTQNLLQTYKAFTSTKLELL